MLLGRLLIIGLMGTNLHANHAHAANKPGGLRGPITYAEIGDRLISSYGFVDSSSATAPADVTVPWIPEAERRRIAFSVLDAHGSYGTERHSERVYEALRNLIKDLELFYANDDRNHANHLFDQLDCTVTMPGQAVLAKMLTSLSIDVDFLKKRRDLIEALVGDEALFNQLSDLVQKVHRDESGILSFWHDEGPTTNAFIESLYFDIANKLNKSPVALELAAHLETFRLIWPSFSDIARNMVVYKIVTKVYPEFGSNKMFGALRYALTLGHNPIANLNKASNFAAGQYDHHLEHFAKDKAQLKALRIAGRVYFYEASFNAVLNLFNKTVDLKGVFKSIKMAKDTVKHLQSRLIGLATMIDTIRQLERLATINPILSEGLVTYQAKDVLYHKDKDMAYLLRLLKTSTFKGKASYLSYNGRVLTSYRLLCTCKDNFAPLIELIGEVDACLSIAKLIKKFSNERVHFSLVDVVASKKTCMKLENFWNPIVPLDMVVGNNLVLGVDKGARNIILTGSNTGGKSTVLKGIVLSALLAQTLGIVPADTMVVTPFAYLGTSMNIVDNGAAGESLYQAEVKRAVGLVEAAQWFLDRDQHCLLVIDELFRGTSPDRAEEQTYDFALRFAGFESTLYILATHFVARVTQLETQTKGICKNHKMEVKRDEQGKLIRTFKLVEGVNTSNVAAEILDNAFGKK